MTMRQVLFSFEGRIPRGTWWRYVIVLSLLWLFVELSIGLLAAGLAAGAEDAMVWIEGLLLLAILWASLALGFKRLHDIDKPGWIVLIPLLLAVLEAAWGEALGINTSEPLSADEFDAIPQDHFLLSILTALVSLYLFICCGFLRGTKGENRFGRDPFGEPQAENPET